MNDDEIHKLLTILHENSSKDTLAYVKDQAYRRNIDISSLYQAMEMRNRYVDVFNSDTHTVPEKHIHSHHFFQIVHCRSNHAAEYLVGAERYLLQRGDIVLVPPGVSHTFLMPEVPGKPYQGEVLWLSTEFILDLQERYPFFMGFLSMQPILLRTNGTRWEQLGTYFQTVVSEADIHAPGWDTAVLGLTILLCTQIFRAANDKTTSALQPKKEELVDRILAYIETNFSHKITLDDVAARFWTSRSTINILFHKKIGISFYSYLTERRLNEAKNLILEDIPLEHINEKVGFTDYSAFYRAFKKKFGMSPKEYKLLYDKDISTSNS